MIQVGSGEADAYLITRPSTKKWDTCAPEAVLTAGGGRVSDLLGVSLVYDPTAPDFLNSRGLLVTSPQLEKSEHQKMLTAVAPIASTLYS